MKSTDRDPFGEGRVARLRGVVQVLGARVRVLADDAGLLKLALQAFGNLPRHRLGSGGEPFLLRLRATDDVPATGGRSVRRPKLTSGAGLLCNHFDAANYAIVSPATRSALVAISPRQRARAYESRYDLVEFAVLTLVARARGLVPLHAACVCLGDRGVLLLGDSGTGKSTLCLRAAADGFELLSEDSVFVDSRRMRAGGVPTFLHVRHDDRRALRDLEGVRHILASPTITRRSGVRKFEVDLRQSPFRLARRAPRITHIVVLRARQASGELLRPLPRAGLRRALTGTQPYARGRDTWARFLRAALAVPAFELRRGATPGESVAALRSLLKPTRRRSR